MRMKPTALVATFGVVLVLATVMILLFVVFRTHKADCTREVIPYAVRALDMDEELWVFVECRDVIDIPNREKVWFLPDLFEGPSEFCTVRIIQDLIKVSTNGFVQRVSFGENAIVGLRESHSGVPIAWPRLIHHASSAYLIERRSMGNENAQVYKCTQTNFCLLSETDAKELAHAMGLDDLSDLPTDARAIEDRGELLYESWFKDKWNRGYDVRWKNIPVSIVFDRIGCVSVVSIKTSVSDALSICFSNELHYLDEKTCVEVLDKL